MPLNEAFLWGNIVDLPDDSGPHRAPLLRDEGITASILRPLDSHHAELGLLYALEHDPMPTIDDNTRLGATRARLG